MERNDLRQVISDTDSKCEISAKAVTKCVNDCIEFLKDLCEKNDGSFSLADCDDKPHIGEFYDYYDNICETQDLAYVQEIKVEKDMCDNKDHIIFVVQNDHFYDTELLNECIISITESVLDYLETCNE